MIVGNEFMMLEFFWLTEKLFLCINVVIHTQGYTKELVRAIEYKRKYIKYVFKMNYGFLSSATVNITNYLHVI